MKARKVNTTQGVGHGVLDAASFRYRPTEDDIAVATATAHRLLKMTPGDEPPSDADKARMERVEFVVAPLMGQHHIRAYYFHKWGERPHIRTFHHGLLAICTSWNSYKINNNWVTDQRGTFKAIGIDGRHYVGSHNGSGMICTLRLARQQPTTQESKS